MPSTSKAQQRLMGQAYAIKKGDLKAEDLNPEYKDEILKLVDSMTLKQLEDYASTSHEGLPNKVDESKQEYANTDDVKTPPVIDKNPPLPAGYPAAGNKPSITPSLFKMPMSKEKKHDRRIMDFNEFLVRINYRTHDDTLQKGHGQNLTGKG